MQIMVSTWIVDSALYVIDFQRWRQWISRRDYEPLALRWFQRWEEPAGRSMGQRICEQQAQRQENRSSHPPMSSLYSRHFWEALLLVARLSPAKKPWSMR